MKVVALISGGKDSCYNMMQCVAEGHNIIALANLKPVQKDEIDSYMYQSVGHHAIDLYAEAMGLPLYRREIQGSSKVTGRDYLPTSNDEVEDLYELLKTVRSELPIEGVAVGAILSNYQRVRVENVCQRLELTPLAFLWRRDQEELLDEMIRCKVKAILIKVAAMGLDPRKHLGKTLEDMQEYLLKKKAEFDLNVCGEGGEFETFTLDCPLFTKKIVLDEVETVMHSDDAFAPVGYLNIKRAHLQDKDEPVAVTQPSRVEGLPMKTSRDLYLELFPEDSDMMPLSNEHVNVQSPGLSAPLTESLKPHVIVRDDISPSPGKHIWISNLITSPDNGDDITSQIKMLMDKLQDTLADCEEHFSLDDLVCVHLYVRNMTDFAAMNSVYRTYFGINPAARVCVQTSLPSNVSLIMDCYGNSNHGNRETMHVQGLSHWAPANIGPYSQCVQIGQKLYVAGQIGMVPANLTLMLRGIQPQARLSLRHVARVLKAMATSCCLDNVITCVCYVTHEEYISVAKHELNRVTTERFQCSPVYVVVPMLPKGALIEWQVVADTCPRDTQVQRHVITDEQLECTVVAHVCPDENINLSVHVYASEDSDKTHVDLDAVMEMVKNCSSRVCLPRPECANWTIFYPAQLFSYENMFKVLQKWWKEEPFSMVPVARLEKENIIISLCV